MGLGARVAGERNWNLVKRNASSLVYICGALLCGWHMLKHSVHIVLFSAVTLEGGAVNIILMRNEARELRSLVQVTQLALKPLLWTTNDFPVERETAILEFRTLGFPCLRKRRRCSEFKYPLSIGGPGLHRPGNSEPIVRAAVPWRMSPRRAGSSSMENENRKTPLWFPQGLGWSFYWREIPPR